MQPVLAQAPPPPPVPNPSATALAAPQPAGAPAGAPTPIPVIAAPTDTPDPNATVATAAPGRHRRDRKQAASGPATAPPAPTPSPTVPGFATLDGTWEVQLQHADSTDYSYLDIKQSGTSLSGTWRVKKTSFAFEDGNCTYDGKQIRIVAKTATGTATFSGYVENGTDMVGLLDVGDKAGGTPFTAGHRGRDKGLFGPGLSPAGIPLPGAGGTGTGNFPH